MIPYPILQKKQSLIQSERLSSCSFMSHDDKGTILSDRSNAYKAAQVYSSLWTSERVFFAVLQHIRIRSEGYCSSTSVSEPLYYTVSINNEVSDVGDGYGDAEGFSVPHPKMTW